MVAKQEFTLGLLLIAILVSGVVYVTLGDVAKFRIDEDKATIYVQPDNRWVVGGREYSRLFDGSSIMNRDKSSIRIDTFFDQSTKKFTAIRQTSYQRGPVIRETWTFSGTIEDVEFFPISHKVEIFNGMGYFYRYTVDELTGTPPKQKLEGNLSLSFGRKINVDLHPGYRWAWIGWPYGSDSLSAQYSIPSDYEVFNFRMYDPEWQPDESTSPRSFIEDWEGDPPGDINTTFWDYWRSDGTYGRYQVTGTGTPHAGSYHLLLDVSDSINENRNKMKTQTGMFTDATDVYLKFWVKEIGEEDDQCPTSWTGEDPGANAGDCVAFTCDGNTWHRILDLTASTYGSYTEIEINITADGDWCGTANSSFQISFGQDDNYPHSSDGVMYDDINITATFYEAPEPTFGCGADPGIYIDGNNVDVDIEYESNVTVCALASDPAETVCVTADHGEIRENYSCGVNSTEFTWLATHNIMRFNDTDTTKIVNFTQDAGGVINYTLRDDVRNDSTIEYFRFDLSGVPSTSEVLWSYPDESGTNSDGSWDAGQPAANAWDEDYATYALVDSGVAHLFMNYTCTDCTGSIDSSQSVVEFRGACDVGPSEPTNYTPGDYDCNMDPLEIRITQDSSGIGKGNYTCKNSSDEWGLICSWSANNAFYESSVWMYDLGLANYSKNVKLDLLIDGTYEWVSWGDFKETEIDSYEYNNSESNQSTSFNGSGTSANYLKLPTHTNTTSATLDLYGTTNDYFASETKELWVWKNSDGKRYTSFHPGIANYDDDDDYFYLFGYAVRTGVAGIQYNYTLKIAHAGGVGSVTEKKEIPVEIGSAGCVVYKTGSDSGFYVLGGLNSSSDAVDDAYHYNPSTDTWTSKTNLPGNWAYGDCVLKDDDVYLVGGYNETGEMDVTWIYNISDNTWTEGNTVNDTIWWNAVEILNDTHLITWCGCSGAACLVGSTKDTYTYDIALDTWTELDSGAHMPNNMWLCRPGKVGDEIYSYGGEWGTALDKDYFYDVYRWNTTVEEWDIMQTNTSYYHSYDSCDERDNHVFCWGPQSFGVSAEYEEIFHYPSAVTMSVGSFVNASYTSGGDLTETVASVSNFSNAINEELGICTPDSEGYCHIPLTFTNRGAGIIFSENLEILTPIPRIDLGEKYMSCDTENCTVNFSVTSDANGVLNLTNMSVQILGTGHINFSSLDSAADFHNHTATIYYSNWNYSFPGTIEYIEFIPSKPNSSDVEPYGQFNNSPILNITALNTGGKNMNWSAYLNETDSCVDLFFNTEWNVSTATKMNDAGWIEFATNKAPGDYWNIYMWANYSCSDDTWRVWYPEFFFRGCCVTCICDNSTG